MIHGDALGRIPMSRLLVLQLQWGNGGTRHAREARFRRCRSSDNTAFSAVVADPVDGRVIDDGLVVDVRDVGVRYVVYRAVIVKDAAVPVPSLVAYAPISEAVVDAPIEPDLATPVPAMPGKQTIRLLFLDPQRLRRICLKFADSTTERTQEFTLRWSPDGGQSFREIVRQHWNFSPRGTTCETEDHRVDLSGVTVLELSIIPDISGGSARASLAQWRLA
jgi:hypothetical protein